MKKNKQKFWAYLLAVLFLAAFVNACFYTPAAAESYNYPSLPSDGPDLENYFELIGQSKTGEVNGRKNIAVITEDRQNQAGAMWAKRKLDLHYPFEVDMEVYLHNTAGTGLVGDGMTFVMHNDQTRPLDQVIGEQGEFLSAYGSGYIQNAVAIEIDTYYNDGSDPFVIPGRQHMAFVYPDEVLTGGSHEQVKSAVFLDSCWYDFKVKWEPEMSTDILGGTLSYEFSAIGSSTWTNKFTAALKIDDVEEVFDGESVFWGFTGSTGEVTAQQSAALVRLPDSQLIQHVYDEAGQDCEGELLSPGDTLTYEFEIDTSQEILPQLAGKNLFLTDTLDPDLVYVPGTATIQSEAYPQGRALEPEQDGNTLIFDTETVLTSGTNNDWIRLRFDVGIKDNARGKVIENTGEIKEAPDGRPIIWANPVDITVAATTFLTGNMDVFSVDNINLHIVEITVDGDFAAAEHQDVHVETALSKYVLPYPGSSIETYERERGTANWTPRTDGLSYDQEYGISWPIVDYTSQKEYKLVFDVVVMEDYAGLQLHQDRTSGQNPEMGSDGVVAAGYTSIKSDLVSEREIMVRTLYQDGTAGTLAVNKVETGRPEIKLEDARFRLYYETISGSETIKMYYAPDQRERWSQSPDDAYIITTDLQGYAAIEPLARRTYYLEEVKAPAGYILAEEPFRIDFTGSQSLTVENQPMGSLEFVVPDSFSFGQHYKPTREKDIPVSIFKDQSDGEIDRWGVIDTRREKAPWQLLIRVNQPLTKTDDPGEQLTGMMKLQKNGQTFTISGADTLVVETTMAAGEEFYNIPDGWYDEGDKNGLYLQVLPGQIKTGTYAGSVTWTLANVP